MATRRLTPQQERELAARVAADPRVQQMLREPAPGGNEALKNQNIQNYLFNDPRSPLYGTNTATAGGQRGTGSYSYDTDKGQPRYTATSPQHWWTDPSVMGPAAVAGTTLGAGLLGVGQAPGSYIGQSVSNIDKTIGGFGVGGWAPAAGATAAGSRGVMDTVRDVARTGSEMNPFLQAALAALSGLPALMMANKGPSDEEKALYGEARQLQQLQRQRLESQNPLFDAVTQLAMSRLPGRG